MWDLPLLDLEDAIQADAVGVMLSRLKFFCFSTF